MYSTNHITHNVLPCSFRLLYPAFHFLSTVFSLCPSSGLRTARQNRHTASNLLRCLQDTTCPIHAINGGTTSGGRAARCREEAPYPKAEARPCIFFPFNELGHTAKRVYHDVLPNLRSSSCNGNSITTGRPCGQTYGRDVA
jgi:hypothetical protein